MKRSLRLKSKLLLLVSLILVSGSIFAQEYRNGMKQGVVRVKFQPQLTSTLSTLKTTHKSGVLYSGIQPFDAVNKQVSAVGMTRVFPYSPQLEEKHRQYGLHLWYEIAVSNEAEAMQVATAYANLAEVASAEPVYERVLINPSEITKMTATATRTKDGSSEPFNDELLSDQWHYNNSGQTGHTAGCDINLYEAWKLTTGSKNVIVSIHDEGIDYKHEDLAEAMWVNEKELNGEEGVDDDMNGYVDDIHGFSFANNSADIDRMDHGTHVAGTIGAITGNGIGVAGVAGGSGSADGVRIMSCQILGGKSSGNTPDSYIYAADNGAVISQNSWGYLTPGAYEQVTHDAIDYFIAEAGKYEGSPMRGGVAIFAAGNSGLDELHYPGAYESCIAVAALDANNHVTAYSNYGDWVDIIAPGGENELNIEGLPANGILSTIPFNGYGYMDGTSMACPHVSGVAALIASLNGGPTFTNENLKTHLLTGVNDIYSIPENAPYIGKLGVGATDAALAIASDEKIAPEAITDFVLVGVSQDFANVEWTVPADQDDAIPSSFEVIYSKETITAENLKYAKIIKIENNNELGEKVEYEIQGLHSLTEYNFAVRSVDRWGNISDFSNIQTATTNDGPIASVDVENINFSLDVTVNAKDSSAFILSNTGEGTLKWNAERRNVSYGLYSVEDVTYPKMGVNTNSRPGALGAMNVNASLPITTYNKYKDYIRYDAGLWTLGEMDQTLTNSSATRFVVNEEEGFNLTNVETRVFHEESTGKVVVEVYEGENINDARLLLAQNIDNTPEQYNMSNIELSEQIFFEKGKTFWIVFHVPAGNEFPLMAGIEKNKEDSDNCYFSSNLGREWSRLEDVYTDNQLVWDVAALSENDFLGNFIFLGAKEGQIASGDSQEIMTSVDASRIHNGDFKTNIVINTNQGEDEMLRVPVSIRVRGHKADLRAPKLSDFGSVVLGNSKEIKVLIQNAGRGTLIYPKSSIDNDQFELVSTGLQKLHGGWQVSLTYRYTPTQTGNANAVATLSDYRGNAVSFSLFGVGAEPPVVEVAPAEINYDNVTIGDTLSGQFTISNTGTYPLDYFFPNLADGSNVEGVDDYFCKNGYSFTYNEGTMTDEEWNDISASAHGEVSDHFKKALWNYYVPVDLGFEFPFFGKNESQVNIARFGMLTFTTDGVFNRTPAWFKDEYNPTRNISAFAAVVFQESFGGEVYYKRYSDRFVVQYDKYKYKAGDMSFTLTFQVVLFDNGNIKFKYKDMGWMYGKMQEMGLIGIEDNSINDGLFISDARRPDYKISNNTTIDIVNPGLGLLTSVDKPSGTVRVGESVDINFTAKTDVLFLGDYVENVNFVTNDPFNKAAVTLNINVTEGGDAEFKTTVTEMDFGQVFQNENSVRGFNIANTGKEATEVQSMEFVNGFYTLEGECPVLLKPARSLGYKVIIKSTDLGVYYDTLKITLADGTIHEIDIVGKVIEAPVINVNLTAINETLDFGTTKTLELTVENTGKNPLEFAHQAPEWLTVSEKMGTMAITVPDKTYTYKTNEDAGGPTYQFENIVALENKLDVSMNSLEDYWKEVALPFTFNFYGVDYDTIYVGYNGYMSFIPAQETEDMVWGGFELPNDDEPNNLICPLWSFSGADDVSISPETGIYFKAEDDRVIVTYHDWLNGYGMGDPISFQAILYPNGNIKFQYDLGKFDQTTMWGIVGLENADGTSGVQIGSRSKWMNDKTAILLTPANKQTIAANSSKVYDVTVDATQLYGKTYSSELNLFTNDPLNTKLSIPASLTVVGTPVVEKPDSIAYGEVMATPYVHEPSWDPQFKSYTQEFEITNIGDSDLIFSSFAFTNGAEIMAELWYAAEGWDGSLMDPKWNNVQWIWGDVKLAPKTSYTFRTVIYPSGNNLVVNDTLKIAANIEGGLIELPISGNVILPPFMLIPEKEVEVFADTDAHTEIRTIVIDNAEGKSDLNYSLNIEYLREEAEASANSAKAVAHSVANAPQLQVAPLAVTNSVKSTKAGEEYNRVLKHEDLEAAESSIGYGGELPFFAATEFTAPDNGFNLSHVQTWYVPVDLMKSSIIVTVLGGADNIFESTVLHTQTFEYTITEEDKLGKMLTIELDKNLEFFPNETFYLAFQYPMVVEQPQGTYTPETYVDDRFFFGAGDDWYEVGDTGYDDLAWIMRAAEMDATSGVWVMLDSDAVGSVPAGEQREVSLAFNADPAMKGFNKAELTIESNDPSNSKENVNLSLYLNQAPAFGANILNETVKENEVMTFAVSAIDPEGDAITYSLKEEHEYLSAETVDNSFVITYNPGYESAGSKVFVVVVTDEFGNVSELIMNVDVRNVNRAPELMAGIEDREYYEDEEFDYINLFPLFTDPDNQVLSYSVYVNNPIVAIFTSDEEMAIRPLEEGSATVRVVASDPEGLSTETSFKVNVGTVTGIEDPEGTTSTKVYPVPTAGPLNIVLGNDIEGEVSISILNVTGLTQYQTTINKMSGEHLETLDISHMASGIYLVKITTTEGNIVKRVVKI